MKAPVAVLVGHAHAAITHYRKSFQPSAQLAEPYAMLAVMAIVNSRTGKRAPIRDVEEALRHEFKRTIAAMR